VVAMAILAGWYFHRNSQSRTAFRIVPVRRGDVVSVISATGTVEPEEVVDIGAQVGGQISSFGQDKNGKTIDYGSIVEEGTILARIDDSLYAADVELGKAGLLQANAGLIRAQADLVQMKAKLEQAQRDWERAQKLGPSEALAPTAYDAYKANFEIAQANVAVDEAAVEQGQAAIAQAQASLDRVQRNLGYCTIKSPVKGVIIDRRVNIGQTVVSSLNAHSLFLIAKDLTRIQVWVSVNEADIGSIHPGQPATFTVDAFPNQTFYGQVGKMRLNATMSQNVVTYTVEVTTDNKDSKLLPYLTANVQFKVGQKDNVLLVPNGALRWAPKPEQIASEFRSSASRTSASSRASQPTTAEAGQAHATLWAVEGAFVRPVHVRLGLTDGTVTEVQGDNVKEGMSIVVGEQAEGSAGAAVAGGASPFTPQLGQARRPANESSGTGGSGGGSAGR